MAVLLAVVASWVAVNAGEAAIERVVRRMLDARFPGRVTLGAVETSWLPPSVRLESLELRNAAGEMRVGLPEVRATLAVWASLWEGTWIADLALHEPEIAWRDEDPFWSELRGDRAKRAGGGAPFFLPRRLEIRSGRVRWQLGEAAARGSVERIDVDGELRGMLAPAVRFTATARAWVDRDERRLTLDRLELSGDAGAGRVVIDRLVVEGPEERLEGSGSWTRGALAASVRWEGKLDPLFALVPEAGTVRGGGAIEAELSGSFEEPVVEARLRARDVVIDEVGFSGTGTLRSLGDDWRLAPAAVEIFGGTAEAEATGRWTGGIPYAVHGRFESWSPQLFLVELFEVDWPIRGVWSGRARLGGHLLGDDVEGGGAFRLVDETREVEGDADFRVDPSSAEVRGTIGTRATGRLTGRYAARGNEISGEWSLAGDRLAPLLAFVGLVSIDASGKLTGELSGSADRPILQGRADLEDLRVGAGTLGAVRGPFRLASDRVESGGLEAFDGRLQASGAFPLADDAEGRWKVTLRELPLREAAEATRTLWENVPEIDASGAIVGTLTGTGTGAAPRLSGRLTISRLLLAGEGPFDFQGSITGTDGWRLEGDLTGDEELRVTVTAVVSAEGSLSGRIGSTGRVETLAFVRDRWPSLRGAIRLDGALDGTMVEPAADARMELTRLSGGEDAPLPDVTGELRLRGTSLEVQASSGELWTASGSLRFEGEGPFEVEARVRSLDVQPFLAPGTGIAIRVTGGARLRGTVARPLEEGRVEIESVSLSRGNVRMSNLDPVELTVRAGILRLAPVTFRDGAQELTLEATLGAEWSEARVQGRGDLRLLEMWVPGVASARGPVDLELRGRRTADGPWRVFGSASVQDAAMDLGFLLGVTEVTGEVRFAGDRAEIPGVTGRLGGGGFLVAGDVARDRGWDLGWALRDAHLGVPAWLDYRASGNGRFSGALAAPKLSGEVEIVQALYDRRVEWGEFLPWFRREAKRSRAAMSVPLELDLQVFADGGLYIDNNLAEAELEGRFDVRGSGENVRWKGRLDVVDGEFVFRRRHFAVTAGSIQFHERRPLNPDLEFRGETTVSTGEADYEILVQVTGTAERPRVEFFADDPALTENDILALVTFGRSVSQLQAQGAGIELGEVLALTAGPKAGEVEERIYDFIPVDRIEIQPTFSRTTGTTEPRLSIGKDLTPRLRALLSSGLGAERQQDVALEYQLTPGIAVQGAWESQTKSEAGAFGGDLKFRVPFRGFRDLSPFPRGDPDEP